MKKALKAVLWSLIGGSVVVLLFTCLAAYLSTSKDEGTAALWSELFDLSINIDLIWSYVLLAVAVLSVIAAAVVDKISHAAGLTKTLIALGSAVVVVGASVGATLLWGVDAIVTAAGSIVDDPFVLKISEIGIYIAYIVAIIAVGVVVFDLVMGLIRRAK
jgi:hypothetical protein